MVPTKRVSKHDQHTLTKRIERIQKKACGCVDIECAEQALSHLYAFGRRFSGIQLQAEATHALLQVADEAIACARPFLQGNEVPAKPHP